MLYDVFYCGLLLSIHIYERYFRQLALSAATEENFESPKGTTIPTFGKANVRRWCRCNSPGPVIGRYLIRISATIPTGHINWFSILFVSHCLDHHCRLPNRYLLIFRGFPSVSRDSAESETQTTRPNFVPCILLPISRAHIVVTTLSLSEGGLGFDYRLRGNYSDVSVVSVIPL